MSGFEKWEIVPLTSKDRAHIGHVLGLDRLDFDYLERSAGQVLRHWILAGGAVSPVQPTGTDAPPKDRASLVRVHPPRQLAEVGLFSTLNLWDEVMPFPFHLFKGVKDSLEFSSPEWKAASSELVGAIQALEQRLFETEISLLHCVSEEAGALTIFSHCVRKRFLTLGRLVGNADELTEEMQKGHLAASFQSLELRLPSVGNFPAQAALIAQAVAELPARPGSETVHPSTSPSCIPPQILVPN